MHIHTTVMATQNEFRSRSRPGSSAGENPGSPIKQIQIEGLVALKIIKHQETQCGEDIQGVLLGLVVGDCLEITNCFPTRFPNGSQTDDADFDAEQYQMAFMQSLRHVNIDHLHVGWYQSTHYGSYISRTLVDNQFRYQHEIEESVVLIYDPIKTAQGSLSLKAYRLTPKLMELKREKDGKELTLDGFRKANIGFEHMLEEVPIVVKNSHLINVLMWELEEKSMATADKHKVPNLSSSSHMEKSLQLLMDKVDDMNQDIIKYNSALRNQSKQQHLLQKRQQENAQRQSKGEPLLPEEDITQTFRSAQPPTRMDTIVIAGQINNYCENVKEITSQNLGKLFKVEALQGQNS